MAQRIDSRPDQRTPTLVELAELVARMRVAHEDFQRDRVQWKLARFKIREREVDRALSLVLGPRRRAG